MLNKDASNRHFSAELIFHQEIPDLWRINDMKDLQNGCVLGNCSSSVGNSWYNFNSLTGTGPFCFYFEYSDGSRFSWCQLGNPVTEKANHAETATDIHYTPRPTQVILIWYH